MTMLFHRVCGCAFALFLGTFTAWAGANDYRFELVSTDDWPGAIPLTPAIPVAIASISQATTTLSVTTAAPHGLKIGEKVSIAGVSDSRLNYSCLTIATTPTPTSLPQRPGRKARSLL